jgi:hypothetical protein
MTRKTSDYFYINLRAIVFNRPMKKMNDLDNRTNRRTFYMNDYFVENEFHQSSWDYFKNIKRTKDIRNDKLIALVRIHYPLKNKNRYFRSYFFLFSKWCHQLKQLIMILDTYTTVMCPGTLYHTFCHYQVVKLIATRHCWHLYDNKLSYRWEIN